MNYRKLYFSIVEKRKVNIPEGYTEKHHVIPRSLGGDNSKDNLVALTAREHFICHLLLTKMYERYTLEWYKMTHAFLMMKCSNLRQDRHYSSRFYEYMKRDFSLVMRRATLGDKNSNYGKRWISNIELMVSKKVTREFVCEYPWVEGRNKWKPPHKKQSSRVRVDSCTEKAITHWNRFHFGTYSSINEFTKSGSCEYTQQGLVYAWKKFIPIYSEISKRGIKINSDKNLAL
jgi:hypothetical protein